MTSGISTSEVTRLPPVLADDVPRAVRVQSQGRLLGRSHCVETGAAIGESPGWRPGGFFSWLVGGGSSAGGGRAQVEAARLRVREEHGERVPAHDVRPGFWALAVADRHRVAEVGYFHTSAVVLAAAGLPPRCVRQVSHRSYSVGSASCLRYSVVSSGSRAPSTARSKDWLYMVTCSAPVTSWI